MEMRDFLSPPAPQFEEVTVTRWELWKDGKYITSSHKSWEDIEQHVMFSQPGTEVVEMTGTRRIPVPVKTKRREEIPRTCIVGASDFPKDAKFYCESME